MNSVAEPRDVVLTYIRALDAQNYEGALRLLDDHVRIIGPGGETFGKPMDFIEMLRKYRGRYDILKVFNDGDDVCLLYDLVTIGPTVYMSSLYQVKGGKIVSIRTVFDPKAFAPPKDGLGAPPQ